MVYEHDPSVAEYQHEKHRPREAEALQTLRKVASLVKPVMRQRGWKVGVLTEFWPSEKNLLGLNWNKGQKICLRLRYPYDERQFIPLDQVVDTMLHELCHIVYGPHDEPFHNLWNQLREEYEQLLRKGYTGEGFLSTGHKLGGRRIPMDEARRQARAAAEKRRVLTAGSGKKLGGAPVRRGQDMRKVIADAAARRATVTKGCASGTSKERKRELVEGTNKSGFRTKAEQDDADEEAMMIAYIDLVQEEEKEKYGNAYIPPSNENPAGSQGHPITIPSDSSSPNPPPKPEPTSTRTGPPIPPSSKPPSAAVKPSPSPSNPPPSSTSWTCAICTLVNPPTYLCCDACSTERPSPPPSPTFRPASTQRHPSSIHHSNTKKAIKSLMSLDATTAQLPPKPLGWLCHQCGNWMEEQWWTCAGCGAMKLSS